MKSIREKFVEDFDEELATKLELAAREHSNGVNDKEKGNDEFRWVLCICIGYQCFEAPAYRERHEIDKKHSYRKIKKWIKKNANLKDHDGDLDYLALAAGSYKKYVKK